MADVSLRCRWRDLSQSYETAGTSALASAHCGDHNEHMDHRVRQGAAGLALVSLWIVLVLSPNAMASSSSWAFRAWQAEDGLPDITITGLAQTSDGYLWVATKAGLVSFNGQEFSLVPQANLVGAPTRPVRFLYRDRRDCLWVCMDRGPLLCLKPEGVVNLTAKAGLPLQRVIMMVEDDQGAVFVVYPKSQVFRVVGEKAEKIALPGQWQEADRMLVARDRAGTIWCAVGPHIGRWLNDGWQPVATLESPVSALNAAGASGVCVASGKGIFQVAVDASVTELGQLQLKSEAMSILEDRSGAVWVGTYADGLLRGSGGKFERVATSDPEITCLFEDVEGNIWAGTAGGGLNLMLRRMVTLVDKSEGLPFGPVISVTEDRQGSVWAAALDGRLARAREGHWELLKDGTDWPGGGVTSVVADPKGGVWIGTSNRGLKHFRDGVWRGWSQRDGLAGNGVRALFAGSNGDLWIGLLSVNQLRRLRDGRVQLITNATPHLGAIRAMAETQDGTIWIGTAEGEVQRVQDMALVHEPAIQESGPRSVRSLLATPDGSLWIGYAGDGLGWLKDGRFRRLTTEAGLPDDFISQLLDDGRGNLWVAGNRGLARIRFAELDSAMAGSSGRVSARRFGSADGVTGVQPNRDYWPSAWRGGDGVLWFTLRNGLLVARPEAIVPNSVPPAVQLERVIVDDRLVAVHNAGSPLQIQSSSNLMKLQPESAQLRLGPGHRKLEIYFAALSFTSPENVQFRYQLSGFDPDWVEAGTRRNATYPHLPAGDYEFRVIACNNSGVWNTNATVLALAVEPFFHETVRFKLGGGLVAVFAAGGLTYAFSRARYRRRLRRLEARRALEQERTRIARDIHDELGSSLTRIVMLSQPEDDDVATTRPEMKRIYETARNLTRTMDEVVWAVNPRQDTLEGLTTYLTAFAQEFTSAANVACRLDLPDHMPVVPLSAEVRHNLFLAAKEAIHNAVRHGKAQAISIALKLAPGGFTLAVSDDGIGFQVGASVGSRHGHGLENMRARLAAIGGKCDISSQPQAGTTIQFTVAPKGDLW